MTKLHTILMAITAVCLMSCSKNLNNYTLTDFMGSEKEKVKELITKELSVKTIDTLENLINRYKRYDLIDKNKNLSINQILDENRQYEKKLDKRREFYDIAVSSLKSRLKFPESAYITPLLLEDSDSLRIEKDTSMKSGEYYNVIIKYKAPNGFGVMLSDKYISQQKRDSTGKLSEWWGRNSY